MGKPQTIYVEPDIHREIKRQAFEANKKVQHWVDAFLREKLGLKNGIEKTTTVS